MDTSQGVRQAGYSDYSDAGMVMVSVDEPGELMRSPDRLKSMYHICWFVAAVLFTAHHVDLQKRTHQSFIEETNLTANPVTTSGAFPPILNPSVGPSKYSHTSINFPISLSTPIF